ncbi:hypothetical protein CsSME_00038735 [Camellia sinensis var. sinensis]|uniref:uncharacterized protein LOC114320555 n=1 Tax=Camellia sinensis TaxID=4442 RepID=UPI0010356B93|nr:uncharacterized protein LOC114320555 [Camellia sinensis]
MEVSNFHAPSVKPWLNRPISSYKGTVSYIRDFSTFPFPCINQSWVLHHPSSPRMKQHNLVLVGSFGRENGKWALPNHRHCSWRTAKYTPHQKASRSYSFKLCQVKSEDSEGTMSGESIILDEQQTLERELQIAIQEENYAQAAKIRDSLRVLQEDGKASVLAANARFYNSFKNGDLASMQALWAKEDNVCVVHPGVSGISGYDLVMGSWEFVWADYEFPLQIEIKDVQVHVRGDLGYVTCIELVKTKGSSWGRQFATNVFERINGQWFICIHHASHVDL